MDTNNSESTAPHSISSLLNKDKDNLYSHSLPTPLTPTSSPSSSPSMVSAQLPSNEKQPSTKIQTAQKSAGGRILSSVGTAPHYGSFTVRSAEFNQTPPGTPPRQPSSKSSTSRIQLTKSFRCDQCFQSFSRLNNLKSHRTTHTSERPYQVSG